MTRMANVRAAIVAIRSSGQMIVVMIEAGTTMPPMPKPAMIKMIHRLDRLSTLATAMAPVPAEKVSYICDSVSLNNTYQPSS